MAFTWLAIGDSITNGTGATGWKGYVYYTRAALQASGKRHFLNNQGIPSITSTQAIARFETGYKMEADVVTIMLGTNDTALTPAQYNANITQLINDIRSVMSNPTILLLTILYRNDANDTLMQQFNSQLSTIASTMNCILVDTRSAFSNATYLADVVHPNDSGHPLVANVLTPVMQGLNL